MNEPTAQHSEADANTVDAPDSVPPKAWVTLLLFAGFVVAAASCTSILGIF